MEIDDEEEYIQFIQNKETINKVSESLNTTSKNAKYYLAANYISKFKQDIRPLFDAAQTLTKRYNAQNLKDFIQRLDHWKNIDRAQYMNDLDELTTNINCLKVSTSDDILLKGYELQTNILDEAKKFFDSI